MRRPPAEYFEFNPATGLISAYTGTDVDVVVPREIGGVTVVGFEGQNAFAFCQDFANTETPTNQTEGVHLRTLVLPEKASFATRLWRAWARARLSCAGV